MEKLENLKVLEVLIEELIRQRQVYLGGAPLDDNLEIRLQKQNNVNRFCDGMAEAIHISRTLLSNGGLFNKDDFLN